jgi:hypothetical protein
MKSRIARRFWQPFFSGDLRIVVGRFTEFFQFEPSGLVGMGCAMALSELRLHLEKLGLRKFSFTFADRIDGDHLRDNLVLLGGPDANRLTREVVTKIQSTVRFGDPECHEIVIRDTLTGEAYLPKLTMDRKGIARDYGAIIKTRNPFDPSKHLLLAAGSVGFGTWGALRYAISDAFMASKPVRSGSPVDCLIETDVVLNTPQDIRQLVLRPTTAAIMRDKHDG